MTVLKLAMVFADFLLHFKLIIIIIKSKQGHCLKYRISSESKHSTKQNKVFLNRFLNTKYQTIESINFFYYSLLFKTQTSDITLKYFIYFTLK